MNFFCDGNGTIFHVDPEPVYQGSVGANTIYFIGAFPNNCEVTVSYQLPHRDKTVPQLMTHVLETEMLTKDGETFSVWKRTLDDIVTAYYGSVEIQFYVHASAGNGDGASIATSATTFNVERGVNIALPEPTDDYEKLLNQIIATIASITGDNNTYATAAGESASRAATSESNAKTYEGTALTYKNAAESAKTDAEGFATAASDSAVAAAVSAEQTAQTALSLQAQTSQIERNRVQIENINAVLSGNDQFAALTTEQGYTTRETADGAEIFDEQNTQIQLIQGDTVACENLFANSMAVRTYRTSYEKISDTEYIATQITNGASFVAFVWGVLKAGTYTLSFKATISNTSVSVGAVNRLYIGKEQSGGGGWIRSYVVGNDQTNKEHTVTFTADGVNSVGAFFYLNVTTPTSSDNHTIHLKDLMLNEGSTAKPFQPYFTGLKHAYFNSIKSTGRNLIPFPYVFGDEITQNGVTIKANADGSLTLNGKSTDVVVQHLQYEGGIRLEVGKAYTLSGTNESNGVGVFCQSSDYTYNINTNTVAKTASHYAWITIQAGYTFDNFKIYPMLNAGGTASPYEPYTEDVYQLPQEIIDLCPDGIPKWDTINPQIGKLTRATQFFEIDGVENILTAYSDGSMQESDYTYFGVFEPANKKHNNGANYIASQGWGLGTWLSEGALNADKGVYLANEGSRAVVVWFRKTAFTAEQVGTVEAANAYLQSLVKAGTPLTVAFEALEPEITDISAPETYKVYNHGSETIVQGDTDNGAYGAMPKIKQTYLGKVGGENQ